jgi:hypothetical protein
MFGTQRISFTFRRIETFINEDGVIIGQGSPYKSLQDFFETDEELKKLHNSKTKIDLIHAFSKENKQSDNFEWSDTYLDGFVLR